MNRFKNILAVYNDVIGAEDALTQAAALATANRARLTLIDVLHPSTSTPEQRREREKCLQRTVNHLKLDGVQRTSFKLLSGVEAVEIINQVVRHEYDIVIASAEGGSPIRNALYGKPAIRLIRKCPCPVWLLKPGHSLQYGRVMACVDPDPSRSECDELNTKIMDLSTSLATSYDADLHILHAWEVVGKDRDTLSSEIADTTRVSLLEKHQGIHQERVDQLLSNYRLERIPHTVHLPQALPERAILKTVNSEAVDLIVIGASSRAGISGFLSGHAAESILAAVRGGVLIVKPDSVAAAYGIDSAPPVEKALEVA